MDSYSFLFALKRSGVYLNGRREVEERLFGVRWWQRMFIEMVLADHSHLLLRPTEYGADKWEKTLDGLIGILKDHHFEDADIARVTGAVQADIDIALVEVEILKINGASDPNLPSHLFPGCGNDTVEFRIWTTDDRFDISMSAVAEAINEIEVDAVFRHFDPDTGVGSYFVVDAASTFSTGTRFMMALNLDLENGLMPMEEFLAFLPQGKASREPASPTTGVVPESDFERQEPFTHPSAASKETGHATTTDAHVDEARISVDKRPRVSVETRSGERILFIREHDAMTVLRWMPDYRGTRRLSVHKAAGVGETGFQIWSDRFNAGLSRDGELIANCRSEGEALGLLAEIETAAHAEATSITSIEGAKSPHWVLVAVAVCVIVCAAIVAIPILLGAGNAAAKYLFAAPHSAQVPPPMPSSLRQGVLLPVAPPLPAVPRRGVNG
ncbi:hypothetical protein [Burkholderia ubonensis]|uniref:hypothetical protein n=1 Tax=Burkholderia ubonensis TaxID=101571 RepID=UPI000756180B|nr:hypothetical protein [Burkholderia ubonensis]KVV07363.1 hypothetical protein WK77_16370 [Burkholderia ubonensis]